MKYGEFLQIITTEMLSIGEAVQASIKSGTKVQNSESKLSEAQKLYSFCEGRTTATEFAHLLKTFEIRSNFQITEGSPLTLVRPPLTAGGIYLIPQFLKNRWERLQLAPHLSYENDPTSMDNQLCTMLAKNFAEKFNKNAQELLKPKLDSSSKSESKDQASKDFDIKLKSQLENLLNLTLQGTAITLREIANDPNKPQLIAQMRQFDAETLKTISDCFVAGKPEDAKLSPVEKLNRLVDKYFPKELFNKVFDAECQKLFAETYAKPKTETPAQDPNAVQPSTLTP